MNLKDKKYLVVGLGKTGISTARFLLSKGAKVVKVQRLRSATAGLMLDINKKWMNLGNKV
jgi:UDP-N-acetylmuramoylalanine-D-glutamate ligase